MKNQVFSFRCGFGAEYWPCLSWGSGVDAGLKWLALIQDDHTYTFKTTGQRWDPFCTLPYGPSIEVK